MRYLAIFALLGLSSSMAMADFQVFEGPDAEVNKKELECRFRGDKGLRCWAEVEFERTGGEPVALNERDVELRIECNNEFEFHDRDARKDWDDGVLKVKGRDNGYEALLKIFFENNDLNASSTDHKEFKARLRLENEVVRNLRGRCEFKGNNEEPEL